MHGVERVIVSVTYLALGAGLLLRGRGRGAAGRLLRDGFRTSYAELARPR